MSDWDASDNESPVKSPPPPPKVVSDKWADEDAESDAPASDWEKSSDEEETKPAPAATAPPKKKGTLKAKLAEKEALKSVQKGAGGADVYDEDAVLDPREKARRDRERELAADLNNATDLLGAAALGGTTNKDLDALISAQPRTKDDFVALSNHIIEFIVTKHQDKPLYPAFVEHHVRALAEPLRDIEVRKAASGLTTLANEKQKAQREAASGKKKTKATTKPGLGSAKVASKSVDTTAYEESLDDFGTNPDDFM